MRLKVTVGLEGAQDHTAFADGLPAPGQRPSPAGRMSRRAASVRLPDSDG